MIETKQKEVPNSGTNESQKIFGPKRKSVVINAEYERRTTSLSGEDSDGSDSEESKNSQTSNNSESTQNSETESTAKSEVSKVSSVEFTQQLVLVTLPEIAGLIGIGVAIGFLVCRGNLF